jgi:hypothetical protein
VPLVGCAQLPRVHPAASPKREGTRLAKKPNYDFEKRRKELERKQKKDAKRDERLNRKRTGGAEDGDTVAEDGAPAEADEASKE